MLASTAATEQPHIQVDQVYRDHFEFVWTNLRRFGVPPELIEDACHDVFVVVHRRATEFDPGRASLTTWVFGIVRRVASDHRRSRQRRERKLSHIQAHAVRPDQHSGQTTAEARSLALQFLGSIDEEHAAIFVLSQLYDVPLREIAVSLELNPNTVASRLRATRKRFKALNDGEEVQRLTGEETPPEDAKARVLAGLCPLLSPSPKPAVLTGFKGAFLGLCIATGIAVVAVALTSDGGPPPAEEMFATRDPDVAGIGPLESAIPDMLPQAPRPESSTPEVAPRPRRSTPKRPQPADLAPPAPAPLPPKSSLPAELALVTEARSAARNGHPTAALRTARLYAKRFPQGLLQTEMDVVRVDSLCRLGRQDDAAAVVNTLGTPKTQAPKPVCGQSG